MSWATIPIASASALEPELALEPIALAGLLEGRGVDGAQHGHHPIRGHTLREQHLADPLGDGDHPCVESVFDGHQPAWLGVVHPPGDHRRDARQARGDPALGIGPAAAVDVQEIRRESLQACGQSGDGREVQVSAEPQGMDLGEGCGLSGDLGPRRTDEMALVPAPGESLAEIDDLACPAVIVPAGLEMDDPHGSDPADVTGPAIWHGAVRRRTRPRGGGGSVATNGSSPPGASAGPPPGQGR